MDDPIATVPDPDEPVIPGCPLGVERGVIKFSQP
jgi:hypothetical protein